MKVAINLFDLQRLQSGVRSPLLRGKLDLKAPTMRAGGGDEVGAVFRCDLLTALLVCDIIRSHDVRDGRSQTRVYATDRNGRWYRLPDEAALTIKSTEGMIPNPTFFANELSVVAPPIAPVKVIMGQ